MSPIYLGAKQIFDADDSTVPAPAAVEFRAHLKGQRGPAARSVATGLASGVRGLAQRLHPPAPVDLELLPEFGEGWTPDADITEED